MNKKRRKELQRIIDSLDTLKTRIEELGNEEEDAFYNMPEGLQESERGEAMSDNISDIDEVISNFEDIMDKIQEIIER